MKVAIVDTTFARINMGAIAIDELKAKFPEVKVVRSTVPGFKDLAVECKRLLNECDIAVALGMAGGAKIDIQCAHEASLAIQNARLAANKHIIEVFVFEDEAWNEKTLASIAENRIRKHVDNAANLILHPEKIIENAGKGIRQGFEDEGSLLTKKQRRFSFVVGEFNKEITDVMVEVAKKTCKEHKIKIGEVIYMPGCFDIPLGVKKMLMDKRNDAVVALGAVIKGETGHDELITYSTAHQLSQLSLDFNKPVTLGIIGPNTTYQQAEKRKETYARNAVIAAIKLCEKLR